jgi:hypothetical protein
MSTRDEMHRRGNDQLHLLGNIRSLMLTWDDIWCIISDFRDLSYMIPTWDDLLLLVTPLSKVKSSSDR